MTLKSQPGANPGATPLPADLREKLAGVVAGEGSVRAAARRLAVSRATVARAHRGELLRPGSHALLSKALANTNEEKRA